MLDLLKHKARLEKRVGGDLLVGERRVETISFNDFFSLGYFEKAIGSLGTQ